MKTNTTSNPSFVKGIHLRSNKMIEYFLASYFILGILLGFKYDTILVALIVGGICNVLYYVSKKMFPNSTVNQYVASAAVGIYTAQFIYQMHGMFEMHFFAFIGSALMITYQNWKVVIPVSVVIAIHHAIFAYLQYKYGYEGVYFSKVDFDLEAYSFHIGIAVIIFFICGLWSYQLEKQQQSIVMLEKISEEQAKSVEFAMNLAYGDPKAEFKAAEGDMLGEALLEVRKKMQAH